MNKLLNIFILSFLALTNCSNTAPTPIETEDMGPKCISGDDFRTVFSMKYESAKTCKPGVTPIVLTDRLLCTSKYLRPQMTLDFTTYSYKPEDVYFVYNKEVLTGIYGKADECLRVKYTEKASTAESLKANWDCSEFNWQFCE